MPFDPELGEIDLRRYRAIESVVEGVHSLVEKYKSTDYVCYINDTQSFQCGAFLLGALMKQLHAHGLLSLRPEVPFLGLRFDDICGEFESIDSPGWALPHTYYPHECTLKSAIGSVVADAKASILGLELDTLKGGSGAQERGKGKARQDEGGDDDPVAI